MAKSIKSLWKKYSDGGATDDAPPTEKDSKLRDKHISDSVPYNTRHAHDHMDEIVNQVSKLRKTSPKLASQLGRKSAQELHKVEEKISHGRK